MEQKINEENIENNIVFCINPRKHLQSNQYQDLFFEIRHVKTKYVYFLFRLNSDFGWRGVMCCPIMKDLSYRLRVGKNKHPSDFQKDK